MKTLEIEASTIGNMIMDECLCAGNIPKLIYKGKCETESHIFFYFDDVLPPSIPDGTDVRTFFVDHSSATAVPSLKTQKMCRCELKEATMRCGRCKYEYYCSVLCQKKDWDIHKHVCRTRMSEEDFWAWFTAGKCSMLNCGFVNLVQRLMTAGVRVNIDGIQVAEVFASSEVAVSYRESSSHQDSFISKEIISVYSNHKVPLAGSAKLDDYNQSEVDRLQHIAPSLCKCDNFVKCSDLSHMTHQVCVLNMVDGNKMVVDLAGYQYGLTKMYSGLPWVCCPFSVYDMFIEERSLLTGADIVAAVGTDYFHHGQDHVSKSTFNLVKRTLRKIEAKLKLKNP